MHKPEHNKRQCVKVKPKDLHTHTNLGILNPDTLPLTAPSCMADISKSRLFLNKETRLKYNQNRGEVNRGFILFYTIWTPLPTLSPFSLNPVSAEPSPEWAALWARGKWKTGMTERRKKWHKKQLCFQNSITFIRTRAYKRQDMTIMELEKTESSQSSGRDRTGRRSGGSSRVITGRWRVTINVSQLHLHFPYVSINNYTTDIASCVKRMNRTLLWLQIKVTIKKAILHTRLLMTGVLGVVVSPKLRRQIICFLYKTQHLRRDGTETKTKIFPKNCSRDVPCITPSLKGSGKYLRFWAVDQKVKLPLLGP